MKHKILLEVTVNEDWNEYVDGFMNKELIAEDLFPYEARKEGITSVEVVALFPEVGSVQFTTLLSKNLKGEGPLQQVEK